MGSVAHFSTRSARSTLSGWSGSWNVFRSGLHCEVSIFLHRDARTANVELYKELGAFIKNRQTSGMATGLDTARLETRLENERQRLELAVSDVERTKLILINALGINFDVKLRLTDELKTPDDPLPTLDYVMDVALTKRPEVKAQSKGFRSRSSPSYAVLGAAICLNGRGLDPCKPNPS